MLGAGAHAVFVDSNVLYSRTQRDWLALLYLEGESPVFHVFWSEDVLAETLYHLRKDHPAWDGHRLSRVRDSIAGTFEVGRVANFEVDGSYAGRDPHDAHVDAAAKACAADILLTNNAKDFHTTGNDAPYDVMVPDDFFVLLDDMASPVVRAVVDQQMAYWIGRSGECHLPESLRACGCPGFAERVRLHQLSNGVPSNVERTGQTANASSQ